MDNQNYQPMTIGDWLITFIITYIPLVGVVMLFVWAFGDGTHPSKKTWAQATLILFAIAIVLGIIFACPPQEGNPCLPMAWRLWWAD